MTNELTVETNYQIHVPRLANFGDKETAEMNEKGTRKTKSIPGRDNNSTEAQYPTGKTKRILKLIQNWEKE